MSRVYIDARNNISAFYNCQKKYPDAEHIHLIRTERIIEP